MTESQTNNHSTDKTHTVAGKEKTEFKHEKHAWPKRKTFGPILLIVGLLLIAGVGFALNSFENQYNGIQNATKKWVENDGSVPVDEKNRIGFRDDLSKIKPVPLLNNGSLAGTLANARVKFMNGQDILLEALREGCSAATQTKLEQSVTIFGQAENDVQSVVTQLGNNAPETEKDFLILIQSAKNLATQQRDAC